MVWREAADGEPWGGFMGSEMRLALEVIKLKAAESWEDRRQGLSFLFLRSGRGKLTLGAGSQALGPGEVVVMDCGTGAAISARDKGELVFWVFCVRLDDLFPLFNGHEISHLPTVRGTFRRWKHYGAATAVAAHCHQLLGGVSPKLDLNHRSQLLKVVTTILNEEFLTLQPSRQELSRTEEHILEVFDSLSLDQVLHLSVAELATKFGCSRRHLNRTFNNYFGISAAVLRMEMRLLKAVSLLRNPEAKVITVAQECGFNHLGLFNTCFKRRFGCTPGQWRKLAAAGPGAGGELERSRGAGECPLRRIGLCPMSGRSAEPAAKTGGAAVKSDSTRVTARARTAMR